MSHASFYTSSAFLALMMFLSASFQQTESAEYVSPDLSEEMFRVEEIKLPVHQMKNLASQLVTMATRQQDRSAVSRRASAQLLALAMQLDLSNQQARELNEWLAAGELPEISNEEEIKHALRSILNCQQWLSNSTAGYASNELANAITDAVSTMNPQAEMSEELYVWSSVMLPLEEVEVVARPVEKVESDESVIPFEVKEFSANALVLDSTTPQNEAQSKPFFSPLKITLNDCDPYGSSSLNTQTEQSAEVNDIVKLGSMLDQILYARRGGLSAYHATISDPVFLAKKNHQLIASNLAMSFMASAYDKRLRDDVFLCAKLSKNSPLTEVDQPWQVFRALRNIVSINTSETSGLIIISPSYEKILAEALVMNEIEFFIRWDIYTASQLYEAIELAVKEPKENRKKADELFESIRELSKRMDVKDLVQNRAVKERLLDIVKLQPQHFSAKMLLMASSRNRETKLSEKTLSLALLEPVQKIYQASSRGLHDADTLSEQKSIYTNAVAVMSELNSFVRSQNRDTFDKAVSLTKDYKILVREMDNLSRTRPSSSERGAFMSTRYRERLKDLNMKSRTLYSEIHAMTGKMRTQPNR